LLGVKGDRGPRAFTVRCLLFILACGCQIRFVALEALTFYISFERTLIPMLLIILLLGPQPERLSASLYMLLYTVRCSLPFLVYLLLNSSLCFETVLPATPPASLGLSCLLLLPFLVKLPLYLLHLWLPKAHVEAPTVGSIMLAAVLLKLGVVGLLRVGPAIRTCGASGAVRLRVVGGVFAAIVSLTLRDLKMLIAFSSIFHIVICGVGLLTGSIRRMTGAIYMLVRHGVVSAGLFYLGATVYRATGSRSLVLNQGLLKSDPGLCLL
jgi:NADH-ubiquinone oxidoreductase chain 4